MGNRFLIALLLIAPIAALGIFLLNQSQMGALNHFTDEWLINRRLKIKASQVVHDTDQLSILTGGDGTSDNSQGLGARSLHPYLYISCIGLLVLLILNQSPLLSIASLLVSFSAYLWWESSAHTREQQSRKKSIESELPTVAEIFSILISAGVSPSTAFEWIGERAQGALGDHIRNIVFQCRNGGLLVATLDRTSQEIASPIVRRFVDSIAISLERGSSLAEQVRQYVGELRVQEQRRLMEKAGKAEIGLMIPVVFLILPISVVFALWPSYQSLSGFLLH